MRSFLQKNHRLLFYSALLLLGLIQSGYTELLDDEAYYWVYSKFMAWGYFDHPPMVALLIKIGYFIFHNEFGVRFLFLLMNILSLILAEKLIRKKNPVLFYGIVLSIAVLQLNGFNAVPDTPLIFFTALFFWCYKKFLQNASFQNIFFLGLVTAALLYSKYHGALIVFFVLLSNLNLFTRYQAYLVGLIALLFFAPHLWWQYQHDWISFRYHLFESNINAYKISFTLGYVAGQILLAGPVAGIILLPASFLYRPKDLFEKGLKFTLAGIYIFFLFSSFRGKVEANWTSPAIVPLIILSHNFLSQKMNWQSWLFRLLPLTLALVVVARIAMIVDILPVSQIKARYHSWHEWPHMMKVKTKGLPVVFGNSYQRASKYWFYSGQLTYSMNSYLERRNNYYLWPIEDSILGKPVFILDIHNLDSFQQKIETGIGIVGYKYDPSFVSFTRLKFVTTQKAYRIRPGEKLVVKCKAVMPGRYWNFIRGNPKIDAQIFIGLFNKDGWIKNIPISHTIYPVLARDFYIEVDPGLPPGDYFMVFSTYCTGTLTSPYNSEKIKLTVK